MPIFLRGLAMGVAEVVPGVSGGTVAFITGIYIRLLTAFNEITPDLIRTYRNHGVASVWHKVDGNFLCVLFLGMGLSILTIARVVSKLLSEYPVLIWAFFFGLIVASVYVVGKQVDSWRRDTILMFLVGGTIGGIVTRVAPIDLPPELFYFFIGGVIAICAWILPGLSGSFILLILGLYGFVIEAIRVLDLTVIISMGAGCAVGLLSFSHLLTFLFRRYRDHTLALLTGFMLGALVKVWPWKITVSYQILGDGHRLPLVQEAVSPISYQQLTGNEMQIYGVVLAALLGLSLVLVVDWFAGER